MATLDQDEIPKGLDEFPRSDATQENLQALVKRGLLPDQPLIDWRVPRANEIPLTTRDEHIVFRVFFERGLDLPCCSFFRGLLFYYGLELVNLNPNSILHIAIFIHLCESFLLIRPHFQLFQCPFTLGPLPNNRQRTAIGGVGIQICNTSQYNNINLPTTIPHWKSSWFFCNNPPPCLPDFRSSIAKHSSRWKPSVKVLENDAQIKHLLAEIARLKGCGVTGETVVYSFMSRGIQPLKHQPAPTWTLPASPTISSREIAARIGRILSKVEGGEPQGLDQMIHAGVPRLPVSTSGLSAQFFPSLLFCR